ncbi:MAG: DUF4145 domain-containing protein [Candidatus Bathyarchaeota archaeon]|nr:DUF4145 domain-containing protein [Candidatus Bathyarchaeota archaeon]
METIVCPYCHVNSTIDLRTHADGFNIYQCDNCSGLMLLIEKGREVVDQYPKRIPMVDKSVPPEISRDYTEAIKCFNVGANRGCVVMCRRALQSSVIERGARKGRLVDQIDELYGNQIITKDIRDWAHEIRLTGNIGAHPDDDGLEDIQPDNAEELLKFMEEYLNYVYIMPAKVAAKRARKHKETEE